MAFHHRRENSNIPRVLLGSVLHKLSDLLILKLVTKDVPYPNSKVFSEKGIGVIEEIFGKLDDMYCSVKGIKDAKQIYIEENRFIKRERLEGEKTGTVKKTAIKKNDRDQKKFGRESRNPYSRRNEPQKRKSDGYNFKLKGRNKRR